MGLSLGVSCTKESASLTCATISLHPPQVPMGPFETGKKTLPSKVADPGLPPGSSARGSANFPGKPPRLQGAVGPPWAYWRPTALHGVRTVRAPASPIAMISHCFARNDEIPNAYRTEMPNTPSLAGCLQAHDFRIRDRQQDLAVRMTLARDASKHKSLLRA